ncbi:MAG: single-stranded DNA-binding protein [Lachnospiraceae bacterium]|nr:single-stranded DNA-binding protein [Lachnospiraceae bacterium]
MNIVVLMGRLTRDPEVRYSSGENPLAIARYTLAVDRRFRRDGEQSADFISCVAFGRAAEFAEKYFHQGIRITVSGRIQTGSYTNKDGNKVYTTEVVVDNQEFAESKAASDASRAAFAQNSSSSYSGSGQGFGGAEPSYGGSGRGFSGSGQGSYGNAPREVQRPGVPQEADDGFMNIPEGIDEELPFN